MLVIAQREGESLFLNLDESIDPSTPVSEVLTYPIEIVCNELRNNQVALAIDAPQGIQIKSEELLDEQR